MKLCPNCKTELEDNARFCLSCMTALDEKEQIQPPVQRRRWLWVLLGGLVLCIGLVVGVLLIPPQDTTIPAETTTQPTTVTEEPPSQTVEDPAVRTDTINGVRYTFRPATKEDHPSGLPVDNYYVLIRVEGTPADGTYRVPAFVGNNLNALVTVVADGAFDGTDARSIDLGYNVRYVWQDAFGGYALTELYLHNDVFIDEQAFSGCDNTLTIHCPDYIGNTKGVSWPDLAADYGFRWQLELI